VAGFLDYVVNAMFPEPRPIGMGGNSPQVIHDKDGEYAKISTYRRPTEVVYIVDAAHEEPGQKWVQQHGRFGGNPSLQEARENWASGNWSGGGIDGMDVGRGGHLPQGTIYNKDDGIGPRRVARKMHLNRFTNASFFDGHCDSIPLANRKNPDGSPDHVANYAYWLRLFGVRNVEEYAAQDPDQL